MPSSPEPTNLAAQSISRGAEGLMSSPSSAAPNTQQELFRRRSVEKRRVFRGNELVNARCRKGAKFRASNTDPSPIPANARSDRRPRTFPGRHSLQTNQYTPHGASGRLPAHGEKTTRIDPVERPSFSERPRSPARSSPKLNRASADSGLRLRVNPTKSRQARTVSDRTELAARFDTGSPVRPSRAATSPPPPKIRRRVDRSRQSREDSAERPGFPCPNAHAPVRPVGFAGRPLVASAHQRVMQAKTCPENRRLPAHPK